MTRRVGRTGVRRGVRVRERVRARPRGDPHPRATAQHTAGGVQCRYSSAGRRRRHQGPLGLHCGGLTVVGALGGQSRLEGLTAGVQQVLQD